jgi:hypothetical protein
MVRVQHGGDRLPHTSKSRPVYWHGLPPTSRAVAATNGTGKFGKGLAASTFAATDLRLRWPTDKGEWSAAFWYRPTANANVGGRGFLTAYDTDALRAFVLRQDDSDDKIKLDIGAKTLASPVQTYTAGQDVFVALRFSTTAGATLSVRTHAGVLTHVHDATATDPGTDADYFDFAFLTDPTDWGDGAWGDGAWGGAVTMPGGVIDNLMIFEDRLTDDEVAALGGATEALGGLPPPLGRLVWHAPFDAKPIPVASPITGGRVYEVSSGTTRLPDDWGFTKAVAVLNGASASDDGVGLKFTGTRFDCAAYLATTGTKDDLVDHQRQFAAESSQEIRVR